MFNLTVSEAHTFYVGTNGWLVHNAGSGGCPSLIDDFYHPGVVDKRIAANAAARGGSQAADELAKLGRQAITASPRSASMQLRSLAERAGLTVESGASHLRVFDPETGRLVTTIPNSAGNVNTNRGIVKAILEARKR